MAEEKVNYQEMHMDQLIEIAKQKEIPHTFEMRKEELIKAIENSEK